MNKSLINILTRTSNRPNYFKECFNSIKTQTYKNINHIISVDNDETEEYVKQYTTNYIRVNIPIDSNPPVVNGRRYAPYNLYLNELRKQVKEGWIMYLDDDDSFINNTSLEKIVSNIKNEDQLMIWRVLFPNRVIPDQIYFDRKEIKLNYFSGIGFMYHSKYDIHSQWDMYSGGDYYFVNKLEKIIPEQVWIDSIYTQIQRRTSMGGFGKKDDK